MPGEEPSEKPWDKSNLVHKGVVMIGYFAIAIFAGAVMSFFTIVYFYLALKPENNRVVRFLLASSHFPILIGMIMVTVHLQRTLFRSGTTYNERVVSMIIFLALYVATGSVCLVKYLRAQKRGHR